MIVKILKIHNGHVQNKQGQNPLNKLTSIKVKKQ